MIYFENIKVLYFVLLPLLILAFLIITNKSNFEEYLSKQALEKLRVNTGLFTTKIRSVFLFVCAFLLAFAMSKPVLILQNGEVFEIFRACLAVCFVFVIF